MNAAALREQIETRFAVPLTLSARNQPETLPTGIAEIDVMTGGIPRGCFTEIAGPASSGRTSVMLSLLAQAGSRQEYCALIDVSEAFDPVSAAEAGVRLSRLLWVRCAGDAEKALKATDLLVQSGGFGLVILDLAGTDSRTARRISLASWYRLRHAVEKTPSVLVSIAQQVNAKSCSALQLEMRQTRVIWSGKRLQGMRFEAESRKHFQAKTAMFETKVLGKESFFLEGIHAR